MNRTPDPKAVKAEIRAKVRVALAAMTPQQKGAESVTICEKILKLERYQQARVVMLYAPLPDEPLIEPVARHALSRGKILLLPRVNRFEKTMTANLVQDWPGDLERDQMGILTPRHDAPTYDPESIHFVLVPGVAFSPTGVRLGRGAGYYDRYLPPIPMDRRYGVCYRCQRVDTIPLQDHDEIMAHVISA